MSVCFWSVSSAYFSLACQYYNLCITGNAFLGVLHKWLGQSKFSFQALGMKTVVNKVGSASLGAYVCVHLRSQYRGKQSLVNKTDSERMEFNLGYFKP